MHLVAIDRRFWDVSLCCFVSLCFFAVSDVQLEMIRTS